MFVLVWVYFITLNIICVYRALQTVTDNRLPAWEVASSAVQTQHSILQYSTARGTRPCFVAFSTCFPLSCEPFLGHFSAPVIVGLRGDNIWLQMPAPRIRIYLPGCIENCAQSLLGTKDLSCLTAASRQLFSVKGAEFAKTISGHFIIKGLILILNFPNVSALPSKSTATGFINICFSLPTRLTIFLVSVSTWFNYWYHCEGTLPPGKRGWMHQCPWIQCTEQINITDLHQDCWLHYFKTPVIDFFKNDISI